MLKKILNNQKGFSLTELMVAISIIGTIGTLSVGKFDNALAAARDAHRKMNIKQVQTALELYYDDNLSYPVYQGNGAPSQEGWSKMTSILANPENQYIANLPPEPLNKDKYVYKYWSDGEKFKITYELEDENANQTQIVLGL